MKFNTAREIIEIVSEKIRPEDFISSSCSFGIAGAEADKCAAFREKLKEALEILNEFENTEK